MNNQLIKKEDLSIIHRIRAFFAKIFNKKNIVETSPEIQIIDDKSISNDFQKNIKVDVSNVNTKERDLKNFIKKIEDKPDIIENLSNDRLDKLISYYEDVTNSKKIKIERLKVKCPFCGHEQKLVNNYKNWKEHPNERCSFRVSVYDRAN